MSGDDHQEPGSAARERRRQQHKPTRGPKVSKASMRKMAAPAIVILVIAAIATAMVMYDPSDDCPGHWHVGYAIFVEDEPLSFSHPMFMDKNRNVWTPGSDIHADDGVYHFHPARPSCKGWGDALRYLSVKLSGDTLEILEPHVQEGIYEVGDGKELRMYYKELGEDWQQVTNFRPILRDQPPDGSAIMITYGELTDEMVERQLAQARTLEGGEYDPRRAQQ